MYTWGIIQVPKQTLAAHQLTGHAYLNMIHWCILYVDKLRTVEKIRLKPLKYGTTSAVSLFEASRGSNYDQFWHKIEINQFYLNTVENSSGRFH